MKKLPLLLFFLFPAYLLFGVNYSQAADLSELSNLDAYKAVVKIKTIGVGEDYELVEAAYGSGVIISADGLVLTNSHVVTIDDSYDGSDEAAGYAVCLNVSADTEPDCSYKAKLIAKDDDLDVALLKIEAISGLSSLQSFSFLNISVSDQTVNGDLFALGFPSIGEETISITKGIISGQINKHSQDWIKTDAVISFGSSGGAAINPEGELIGITTSAHSDLLGGLGYVASMKSLNPWVIQNKNKAVQTESPLLSGLNNFISQQKKAGSNIFLTLDKIKVSITRPQGWVFVHDSETTLRLEDESDFEGGIIIINAFKYPFVSNEISKAAILSSIYDLGLNSFDIVSDEAIAISGRSARKLVISVQGEVLNFYLIPQGQYIVSVLYDFGEDSKDKALVEKSLESLIFDKSPALDNSSYSHNNSKHDFAFKTSGDWFIANKYVGSQPLVIFNKKNYSRIIINVSKESDDTKQLSDELLLSQIKTAASAINSNESSDIKFDIIKSAVKYKVNEQIKEALMVEAVFTRISTGEKIVRNISYSVRKNGKLYSFDLLTRGLNDADYKEAVNGLSVVLQGFSWGANSKPQAGSSNTVVKDTVKEPVKEPAKGAAVKKSADSSLSDRLQGKVLLQVEGDGEAWYVFDGKKYYLKDGAVAYGIFRKLGLGITNENLAKIPVGIDDRAVGLDTDSDGVDDKTEEALGTNPTKDDTDGDGYKDGQEIKNGYNPKGLGKNSSDSAFTKKLEGKILLQVEGRGESWYIYNGKKYYLADGDSAYKIMKFLSLGISNADLGKIEESGN